MVYLGSLLLYILERNEESLWKGRGGMGGMGAASPLWISPGKLGSFNSKNISSLSTWKKK